MATEHYYGFAKMKSNIRCTVDMHGNRTLDVKQDQKTHYIKL